MRSLFLLLACLALLNEGQAKSSSGGGGQSCKDKAQKSNPRAKCVKAKAKEDCVSKCKALAESKHCASKPPPPHVTSCKEGNRRAEKYCCCPKCDKGQRAGEKSRGRKKEDRDYKSNAGEDYMENGEEGDEGGEDEEGKEGGKGEGKHKGSASKKNGDESGKKDKSKKKGKKEEDMEESYDDDNEEMDMKEEEDEENEDEDDEEDDEEEEEGDMKQEGKGMKEKKGKDNGGKQGKKGGKDTAKGKAGKSKGSKGKGKGGKAKGKGSKAKDKKAKGKGKGKGKGKAKGKGKGKGGKGEKGAKGAKAKKGKEGKKGKGGKKAKAGKKGKSGKAGEDLLDRPEDSVKKSAPSHLGSGEGGHGDLSLSVGGKGKDCKENIMKKYPDAECLKARDKDDCRRICEEKGEAKCKGSQGEIHKLNCKGEEEKGLGDITCCCSVKCESQEKTRARLDEELRKELGDQSSGICVEVKRQEIKKKLKEKCKTEDRVFIARKYCMEKKKGKYYCVKDGKCFGTHCKGCIKHECEINGRKEVVNPPQDYVDRHLKSKDFDKNVPINVDDMKNVEKIRQWCTMIKDRKQCKKTCQEFGDKICHGNALKYDHDDYCKRKAKECKCCCEPVCRKPEAKKDDHGRRSGLDDERDRKSKFSSVEDRPTSKETQGVKGSQERMSPFSREDAEDDAMSVDEEDTSMDDEASMDEEETTLEKSDRRRRRRPGRKSSKKRRRNKSREEDEDEEDEVGSADETSLEEALSRK